MLCPNCKVNKAIIDKHYGVLYCKECRNKQRSFKKPSRQIEFTSEDIKEGRKEFGRSTLQRFRDGKLSKEFIEAYPETKKSMIKEGVITDKQAKNAKNVWGDVMGHNWERSK